MDGHVSRRDAVAAAMLVGALPMTAYGESPRPSATLVTQLAPSGRLRAAINTGNVVLAKPGGPRGATGVSVDIADELARRLRVPVDLIVYETAGAVVDRQAADWWDIAFLGIDPARAKEIAFTPPYVVIEGTYLVRDDSPYRGVADLDRPGVRIAVSRGSAYDLYLTRAIKAATLVRFATSPEAVARFTADRLDAAAGIREALVAAQRGIPSTRVLTDSFNRIEQAMAVPRQRGAAAAAFAAALVDELKASGFIRASLDRNGHADLAVAPSAAGA